MSDPAQAEPCDRFRFASRTHRGAAMGAGRGRDVREEIFLPGKEPLAGPPSAPALYLVPVLRHHRDATTALSGKQREAACCSDGSAIATSTLRAATYPESTIDDEQRRATIATSPALASGTTGEATGDKLALGRRNSLDGDVAFTSKGDQP
jgi:hypothetical protein